jgi:hypothetical protein
MQHARSLDSVDRTRIALEADLFRRHFALIVISANRARPVKSQQTGEKGVSAYGFAAHQHTPEVFEILPRLCTFLRRKRLWRFYAI